MRNGNELARKLGTEAVGTFFVTLAAAGVDVLYYTGDQVDFVSRWIARGAVAATLIYALSEISGAHINPVVSLAFALRRAMPAAMAAVYIVAQFAGAFAAAGLTVLLWSATASLGASHPGEHYAHWVAAATEVILTFLVIMVILATADKEAAVGKQAALAVGLAIVACGMFAGPISGASMNPARSISVQIVTGQFDLVWIYLVGPVVGAALAAIAAFPLQGSPDEREHKAATGRRRS